MSAPPPDLGAPFWDRVVVSPIDGSVYAPGYEGATYAEREWDALVLGGQRIPGVADVEVEPKRRCQKKKENGSDGATPTFRGMDPSIVRVGITLWTPDQLNQWQSLLPFLFPPANKGTSKLNALDIAHPITAMHGIKSVIVTGIKSLRGTGLKRTELECMEFVLPSKSSTKSLTGSFLTPYTKGAQGNAFELVLGAAFPANKPVPPSKDGKTLAPPKPKAA